MAEPDLGLLQVMVQRVLDKLGEHDTWQVETSKRLVAIERHIAAVRRDAVLDGESVTNVEERVDALSARIARIERRLELAG
jgi:hypothetical protein